MKRATFTIYEEFRLIDKAVLDSVIRPFAYVRQAPYLKDEKYKHDKRLIEEPKEVLISSAYHKGLWWYDETKANLEAMLRGENSGAIFLDYSLSLLWNIKTSDQIRREKSKMDEIIATEEYDNIPWGESTNAYFRLSMFEKSRKIERSFYPQRADSYNPRKNPYGIEKQPNEIRIISLDVASKGGEANDLSVFSCFRLIPEKKGYRRQVVYLESYSGKDTPSQALRFKQLWFDFEADFLVLDAANMGGAVYEQLSMPTYDPERDVEYPAMCIMDHATLDNPKYEDLRETKTLSLNGLPIVYPIIADQKLNSQIAVEMRDKLQKRMIDFLVKDTDAEGYLLKNNKEFSSNALDSDLKAWYLQSYIQTNLLVNECINLEMNPNSLTHIQLKPSTSRGRKDRYSSVSYGNYFATLLDGELLKENEDDDWEKLFNTMLFTS